jgi:hypothetical protein
MDTLKLDGLAPMLPVSDVQRAIDFYVQLGFEIGNTHAPEGSDKPVWAWLHCGRAHVMVNQSDRPIDATHSSASLWLYCKDVVGAHRIVTARGLDPSEISYPFYNPGGEFHVHDPDGYAVFVAHYG